LINSVLPDNGLVGASGSVGFSTWTAVEGTVVVEVYSVVDASETILTGTVVLVAAAGLRECLGGVNRAGGLGVIESEAVNKNMSDTSGDLVDPTCPGLQSFGKSLGIHPLE